MTGGENQSARTHGGRLKFWSLGVVAVILGVAFWGDRGVMRFVKLTHQRAALVDKLEQVNQQSSNLREEISALRNDRHYIERLARTELGMVRDDELVFQFANNAKSRPAADM